MLLWLTVLTSIVSHASAQQNAGSLRNQATQVEDGGVFIGDEEKSFWRRFLDDESMSFEATIAPTPSPTTATCQEILWSDEFDLPGRPNESFWTYADPDAGSGNVEIQTYTSDPANSRVEDGNLFITVLETEENGERGFTSARLRTRDKVEVLYGNVEARIKIPNLANGLWPAFWMLGGNRVEVGWPQAGEIDIMEMGSKGAIEENVVNRRVSSAAHWESNGKRAVFSLGIDTPMDLNDGEFHILRAEWTPDRIVTYIDDNMIWAMDITPEKCSDCTEFHHPYYIIFNVAVGGRFTGILDAQDVTAMVPAELVVDYVRICDNGHTRLSGTVVEDPTIYDFDCGDPDQCTIDALNNYVGDAKCGDHIQFLIDSGLSEAEACRKVAGEDFPSDCGSCIKEVIDCGKPDTCTDDVLDTDADGFSCRDRISFLVRVFGQMERDACNRVASAEFPEECGPCNQFDCNRPTTCTSAVLNADADGASCGDRMQFLISSLGFSEVDACNQIASVEFPAQCGPCNPLDCNLPESCTREVLNTNANDANADATCGGRIAFLVDSWGFSETDACNRVASVEFPSECGPCNPIDCNVAGLCTEAILEADTGGVSCRDRILFEMGNSGLSETEACYQIAETYSSCSRCKPIDCGVPDVCTAASLDAFADGATCRDRITFLMNTGLSEIDACLQIAETEFPAECSACTPPP